MGHSVTAGRLRTLIVQGVLMTNLAAAADIVLPGACFAEKDATFTNMTGRLQMTARAIPAPGEAQDDTRVVLQLAAAAGAALPDSTVDEIRRGIAAALPDEPGLHGITEIASAEPASAKHWLQASNPSERVKWDTLFQDLPPVKFIEMLQPTPTGSVIPLRKVE
jgi:anaerobic selenocysteine-containing dehydrogenase